MLGTQHIHTNSEIELSPAKISRDISQIELEHRIHIEELREQTTIATKQVELENKWTSCCFTCDKRMVVFLTQVTILAGVIIFSAVQLFIGAEPQSLYVGLLSSAVGYALPGPSLTGHVEKKTT